MIADSPRLHRAFRRAAYNRGVLGARPTVGRQAFETDNWDNAARRGDSLS
jgi:hypothetical protein